MAAKRASSNKKSTKKTTTKSRAKSASKSTTRKTARPKVGSRPGDAQTFAKKKDFGIPERKERGQRTASEEIKNRPGGDHLTDPRPSRSGGEGLRETGVGSNESGPGSGSGGDVDTDIVGVGDGGNTLSQGGPDDKLNTKEADDDSR
jgi:hypothetical protein